MSHKSQNVIPLPSAQEEERLYDGVIEMVTHLPAHPQAYLLKPIPSTAQVTRRFSSLSYRKTEYFKRNQLIDTAIAIVPAPKQPVVSRSELIAVGFSLSFSTRTEWEYQSLLARLMEKPPFSAEYLYEEKAVGIYPQLSVFQKAFRTFFGIPTLPIAVDHMFSFWRMRFRIPPPKNVIPFTCAKHVRGT